MKKVISMLTMLLFVALISPLNQLSAMNKSNDLFKINKNKMFSTVDLKATNSTNDNVIVTIRGNGVNLVLTVAAHTPANTVIAQLPEDGAVYTVTMTSMGGAHDMWIYWEHKTNVTGFSTSNMALGCNSCAVINIFN